MLLTLIRTFWLDFKFLHKSDNQLKVDFSDELKWQKALKLILVEEKKIVTRNLCVLVTVITGKSANDRSQ